MLRFRLIICALVLLSLAAVSGLGGPPADRLTDEDRKLFAWFDQLGIEDFSHAPLGRVQLSIAFEGGPRPDEPRAFLLSEKDGHFRFLFNDLMTAVLERKGGDPSAPGFVAWRTVPLEEETGSVLSALTQLQATDIPLADGHHTELDLLALQAQAFVLARYCLAQQREDLAAKLIRAAEQFIRAKDAASFEAELKSEIGATCVRAALLEMANPQKDRHVLAARFEELADRFPNLDHPKPGVLATMLRKMAVEDDAHPKISAPEFAKLSPEKRASELIFQLRDECLPGRFEAWTRPWPFAPALGNGAMKELGALGRAAAPALLAALEDERPSRSIRFLPGDISGPRKIRNAAVEAEPIRVLALAALCRMAGVDFDYLAGQGPAGTHWPEVRRLAGDWWKTTQEQGEVGWFRAQLTLASVPHIERYLQALATRHPEALPTLLPDLIPRMSDALIRFRMIGLLDQSNTAEVNAFLVAQMASDPECMNRVEAARVLHHHHQPEALAAMLAEFDSIKSEMAKVNPPPPAPGAPPPPPELQYEIANPLTVVRFLLSCDSPLAIHEVQVFLPRCPVFVQILLINETTNRLTRPGMRNGFEPQSKATRQAMEQLFLSELDNKASAIPGSDSAYSARVADYAARALAEIWPAKYEFDSSGSVEKRTAQIAAIRAKYKQGAKSQVPSAK